MRSRDEVGDAHLGASEGHATEKSHVEKTSMLRHFDTLPHSRAHQKCRRAPMSMALAAAPGRALAQGMQTHSEGGEIMKTIRGVMLLVAGVLMLGCATAPKTAEGKRDLVADARRALGAMQIDDPTLAAKMQSWHAYAVFPNVGAGGLLVGGEYGRGVVIRNGNVIGYASLKSASVGLQAGGQTFDELILFQDSAALDRMINQGLSFTGQAEGTMLKTGAAEQVAFRDGIAVLIKPIGGLMANISIGGQSISFVPAH